MWRSGFCFHSTLSENSISWSDRERITCTHSSTPDSRVQTNEPREEKPTTLLCRARNNNPVTIGRSISYQLIVMNMPDSAPEVTPQSQPRQRLLRPPLRLNWPSSLAHRDTETKRPQRTTDNHRIMATLKRSRPLTLSSSALASISTYGESSNNINDLWAVRYTPQSSTDLVVATKKVQEIRQWMKFHTNANRRTLSKESKTTVTYTYAPPMLILVGSPGIGKSTCVRCLADELQFDISEWTESFVSNFANGQRSNGYENNLYIQCSNPLDSFEQFLQQCGSDILPLSMQVPISRSQHSHLANKLIVIDELPYTHSTDAKLRLQQIITTHIRRPNRVPTIFICSDTAEGKIRYDDLERYIQPQTLYEKSFCQILAINAPTKTKFRKVIHDIVTSECATLKHQSFVQSSYTYMDELYDRCNGDLRFAITTLQFEMIGDTVSNHQLHSTRHGGLNRRMSSTKRSTSIESKNAHRDSKLSPFHALGKLLYAKRLPNVAEGARLPLEFDPDIVIQQTDMELGDILYFLSYHSVDFFTDVDDLSEAMSYFSDTSTLCDHQTTSGQSISSSSSPSLINIATSMAGRVVAHANTHPAPHVFRALGAPKVYDMIRKRRGNQDRIEQYSQNIWLQENIRNAKIGGHINARTFGMDILPYIRCIIPDHHISTSYLDSMFGSKSTSATALSNSNHSFITGNQDAEVLELWKEQEEILKADDIVEDIEDEEGW